MHKFLEGEKTGLRRLTIKVTLDRGTAKTQKMLLTAFYFQDDCIEQATRNQAIKSYPQNAVQLCYLQIDRQKKIVREMNGIKIEISRKIDKCVVGQIDRQIDRQKDRYIERYIDRKINRQKVRKVERQINT